MSPQATVTVPPSVTRRVLVVDDDVDFAASLSNVLRLEGYDVRAEHSAAEASTAAAEYEATVALVDIRLGSANGVAVIRKIAAHRPQILIVMMSAYTSSDTAIDAFHHGAFAYLNKPFHDHELLTTLDRCFDFISLEDSKRAAEEKLWETRQQLEQTVSERTAALIEANHRLEREINERARTETALRTSEEALAKAQAIANVGHWRWSIPDGCLISFSDEYANIHGAPRSQTPTLMRRQMEAVIHPEDREWVEAQFERYDKEGCNYEIEYRIVRPDGETRFLVERGEAVQGCDGKPTEQIGTVQDTTERKHFEQQLVEAKALAEQASLAKSEFLARMSHELRTPMNAVLGFAQLLESGTAAPLVEKQSEFVTHILNAGHHLLHLIEEVLDMAQVESGRTQLFLEAVDPKRAITECSEFIETMAREANVRIENRVLELLRITGSPSLAPIGNSQNGTGTDRMPLDLERQWDSIGASSVIRRFPKGRLLGLGKSAAYVPCNPLEANEDGDQMRGRKRNSESTETNRRSVG